MKRTAYALIGSIVIATGLVYPASASASLAPANAEGAGGNVTQAAGGSIYNNASSGRSLRIGHHWCGGSDAPSVGETSCGGSGTGSDYAWLSVGQSSTGRWDDTDTFGVIGGCELDTWVYVGIAGYRWSVEPSVTTWYKVNNIEHVEVINYTC